MAEYTVDLRYLLARGYPLALDSYPIWAEEYRSYLNNKIIDHFYFREIGQETPDRFNFFLRRKMNEIMPYYNKLYESELISFDPLATEFFKEGTDYEKKRNYDSVSKNKGKRGETQGEVLSKNVDTTQDTNFGQKSNEKYSGDYRKNGAKTVGTTSKKTENFTQDKVSKNTDDFVEDKTSKKTEAFKENRTGNELVTNNLHTKQVSNGEATGTSKKVASQDTVFSDIPQAGIQTTVTTAPDGTVTRNTKGYATTTTGVDGTENVTTKDTTKNQTDTDNTGTVNTDTTGTTTNDNVTDITDKKTNANVTDYTETVTNDNVTDFTENEKTVWSENGDDKHTDDYTNDETTKVKGNNKEDSERNLTTNVKTGNTHTEQSVTGEKTNEIFTGKGRKGANPSELIIKYRESLINIDMMIIGELETLFMGVY